MLKFGKSEAAISPGQYKEIVDKFEQDFIQNKGGYPAVRKIEADYGKPGIIEDALDYEISRSPAPKPGDWWAEGAIQRLINHKDRIRNARSRHDAALPLVRDKLESHETKTAKLPKKTREEKLLLYTKRPPFVPVRYTFIDRILTSPCHKNPTATLLYLLKHRGYAKKQDKHHTGTNWYSKKNLIVASPSQSTMVRELGLDRSTVKRHISKLVENGDIKVVLENRENVYILGYVDDDEQEQFFYQGGHD